MPVSVAQWAKPFLVSLQLTLLCCHCVSLQTYKIASCLFSLCAGMSSRDVWDRVLMQFNVVRLFILRVYLSASSSILCVRNTYFTSLSECGVKQILFLVVSVCLCVCTHKKTADQKLM